MSSELTIDIQLTELGFSSWDFQLLKQKETPQTNGSASVLEATAAPSAPPAVESHVDEETNISVGQECHDGSPSDQDSESNAVGSVAVPTGKNDPHIGPNTREGTEYDEEDDVGVEEDGDRKMPEEQRDIRRTDGNWEIDVAVYDEEENEDNDSNLTEDNDDDVSSDTNGSDEHRCHVCALTFSTTFLLREHLHVHTGVRPYCCAECGKQFCHLVNYRAHLRSHSTFYCLICRARFATQELLQSHLDTNHFEKEFYQCDFCKRIFVNLDECKEHVQAHKQEVGSYPCPQCDRSFHHRSSLLCHLKWHKKSALICTDCGQAFTKKIALLRHSFVHLGLLPYTCVHCKRHFRLASLYHKHECKPEHIQCVACLVVFQSQDDFEKHKKDTGCWGHQMASPAKTNDIRCMECGQIFDSAEELKKHAGTHQKVMKCAECGMGFRSSLMLMSHMGGHAAQRPCLCKECGLGFPHQHAYDSHLKMCGSVSPPEASVKKPKAPNPSKKKDVAITPKNKVFQAVTLEPQKDVSQSAPLNSVAPISNQTKPSKGAWTLILNKEHLPGNVPLVMFLPTTLSRASEGIQNPQNLVPSAAVLEKRLSVPRVIDIPLAATSQVAKSDKPVLLEGITSPGAEVVIPFTSADSSKIRWTVLDQHTSGSVTNTHTTTKVNKTVVAIVESKQTLNMSLANEQKGKVPSSLEILNTMPKKETGETKPSLPSLSTAGSHDPETPLCLVKVKTEPDGQYKQQRVSALEESDSSPKNAEVSADGVIDSSVLGSVMTETSGPSEAKTGISPFKKEPVPWEDCDGHKGSPDLISPCSASEVVKENLCQCEICGIVLLEKNMSCHSMEHSSILDSSCVSRCSPPASPPSKRLNLG
ncbi:zinc finger and BTB domain-containing protein 17 [Colossoma macropomum]|uniref:zinc finger and BTB domain-containing protein 17 n=1 Tax=Colossoma macropomum TaxID=42526 RepID=UPI001863A865|nr:zinc finger and BTB domain-containing protein 17 [Colossoma macropomum]